MSRIYWRRNPGGAGRGLDSGYLVTPWFDLAYRGFRPMQWVTYFSLTPVNIGSTKLYRLGPIGLFWKGKTP